MWSHGSEFRRTGAERSDLRSLEEAEVVTILPGHKPRGLGHAWGGVLGPGGRKEGRTSERRYYKVSELAVSGQGRRLS